jgi:tRNA(fMet)-specific endonuclease VapC
VVKAELFYGAYKSARVQENLALLGCLSSRFASVAFDDLAADECGKIRASLATLGTPIGPNDLMIAAIAAANRLTLVTRNTREFERIAGLQVEDWESPASQMP